VLGMTASGNAPHAAPGVGDCDGGPAGSNRQSQLDCPLAQIAESSRRQPHAQTERAMGVEYVARSDDIRVLPHSIECPVAPGPGPFAPIRADRRIWRLHVDEDAAP
jgi:hypothetical protein